MSAVWVAGSFDNLRSYHLRLLEEAARLGEVNVLLYDDILAASQSPQGALKFPLAERLYVLDAVRYISRVQAVSALPEVDERSLAGGKPDAWVMAEDEASPARLAFAAAHGIRCHVIPQASLERFPAVSQYDSPAAAGNPRRIIVTGCFDWLHSGHVRFFEEVSSLGSLIVAVGHDANLRLLKGEGHPLFPERERLYMVQAIRHVSTAVLTSGDGWMDAAPEIARLKPDAYAVNDDGDKAEKRAFCQANGLEYIVLKRAPKPGLPRRQSTDLRGF